MKSIFFSIAIATIFIGGAIFLTRGSGIGSGNGDAGANNVTVVDGKQYVELRAKGGYVPRRSTAKANLPTVLRVTTNGTFDCSASIRIPSLKIYKTLTSTGSSEFDLGTPAPGILRGSCGMGMYPFEIEFQV